MPNLCCYDMKLKGTKENMYAFIRKMNNFEEPNHFWRIFSCDIYEAGDGYCCFCGDCAWSLETCCRASGYSNGIDLFAVNTRDFNLELECYSSEPSIGFEEHYIYKNGECITSECADVYEYWYGDFTSFEEFKKEYNLPNELTEDDLDDEYYRVGGFGDWAWNI